MTFEFKTAGTVLFGSRSSERLHDLASQHGSRVFVVTGSKPERYQPVLDPLSTGGLQTERFAVPGEPSTSVVTAGLDAARSHRAEVVVALGGGSVIDTGKIIAALMTNEGELYDYLEVVGGGQPVVSDPVPFIALPTTSGTGSEATRNAVISVPEHKVKVSVRSPLMLPRYAVVDPDLTHTCPPTITASSGLDAITQLLEAFVSRKRNPFTDAVCREGLPRAGRSIRTVYRNPSDVSAREDMALAALFSGVALANAGLGAVHGFAGPLGGLIGAPHGELCAALLGPVTETNRDTLRNSSENEAGEIVTRYDEAARLLLGDSSAGAQQLIDWIYETVSDLRIVSLGRLGLSREAVPEAVAKAQKASSMKGNPVELREEQLTWILQRAM